MSSLRLRTLREDELPAFIETSRSGYEADMVAHAGMSFEEARAKAERDSSSLFPDGRPAPGNHVFVLEDGTTGATVGRLWFAEVDGRAWLYDIHVDEVHRGQGLGREAMALLEGEARRRGLRRVELNVFGGNEPARSLYRSLGYAELAVKMGKDL